MIKREKKGLSLIIGRSAGCLGRRIRMKRRIKMHRMDKGYFDFLEKLKDSLKGSKEVLSF